VNNFFNFKNFFLFNVLCLSIFFSSALYSVLLRRCLFCCCIVCALSCYPAANNKRVSAIK